MEFNEQAIIDCIKKIYHEGPVNEDVLSCLSVCKYLIPDIFKKYESTICILMGLFYKNIDINSVNSIALPFLIHKSIIKDDFSTELTPTQADIRYLIKENETVMFSAPTSIGKSFILRQIILSNDGNTIVMVPSRALLNEYAHDLRAELIKNNKRDTNVLTFIENVNTKHAARNIYVLTPERCFDLFKTHIDVSMFVIDEAQMIDKSNGLRSLKYRDVILRIKRKYKNVKKIFAYPFADNLNELIDDDDSVSKQYKQRNVGQLFIEEGAKYNIVSRSGDSLVRDIENPISRILSEGKRVLVYCEKSKIFNGSIFSLFDQYITICKRKSCELIDDHALNIIRKIEEKIGANPNLYRSQLVSNLKNGVAIHHGSLPHDIRVLIEEFIRLGYAQICFATSTLEQGVNLPFDLIYIRTKRFISNILDYKNIIGRAGRSTMDPCFDYGIVVVRNKKDLMERFGEDVIIDSKGEPKPSTGEDIELFDVYKDAIGSNSIDGDTNLPLEILNRLSSKDVENAYISAIDDLFDIKNDIKKEIDKELRKRIVDNLFLLYSKQLRKREPDTFEKHVFSETIKIMIKKLQKKRFSQIVAERYAEAQKRKWKDTTKFYKLPCKIVGGLNLFDGISDEKYYFDLIVYDTYQYIDQNYNLYLKDLLYGAGYKYQATSNSQNLNNFLNLLKYGSLDEEEIMLFRYGFNDDEIDLVKDCITFISEEEIIFNDLIYDLEDDLKAKCLFYKY